MTARKKRGATKKAIPANPLQRRLAVFGPILAELRGLPDDFNVDETACEAITGVSRTTLWRIEHGLDRSGKVVRPPELLLRSFKVGPKRKLRVLGDVRAFVRRQRAQGSASLAA
jgi:hypothetical protein